MPISLILPSGHVATVSEADWPRVSRLRWSLKNERGYVRAFFGRKHGGPGVNVSLHRFIMSPPPDLVVDHIDGNPLNNTRENLQIVTQSRNCMRRPDVLAGGIQRYGTRWRVRIAVDGKQKSYGLYDTREMAEKALEAARAEAWGAANVTGAIC